MSQDRSPPEARREPVRVDAGRAFAWYAEAMRLFRLQPWGMLGLAVAVIASEFLLSAIPIAGRAAATIIVPIVACSLLFASLATDRADKPRPAHLIAAFAAPFSALAAVILAGALVFAVEWIVAWQVQGIDLLAPLDASEGMSGGTILAVYAMGVAASLPLTLVPLHALFEGAGVSNAFSMSIAAFARNLPAFALYGVLSYLLLAVAMVTMGIGFLIALPLWAASSYAAWKELYGLGK